MILLIRFLLYSLGVFGVGSEPVIYLPANNDPPFLDTVPMGMLTVATLPAVVVSVINSLALIVVVPVYIFAHALGDQ